ncbi:putative xanthine dehydrogenase YagR, molybdenum binding subunit [Pseudomonas syringae pv. tagetis]|uniref:Putative xanthine dehydrogenase YagR, molybdenum binding subunit n=1 Tax=Pseudomonas syringae pv. tagetis TaxID=129140 RepID=A0A3M3Z924_9PSED|nr:xanthine dehydrogenase family protein molybdopterin-binding subunit [Pseudomonas syringae group genomosp. 7]RMO90474.1 putative xanthine dehydrogenase YagR, molybdenum binding subunit [Pseudomonas syringae pv. tagetis]
MSDLFNPKVYRRTLLKTAAAGSAVAYTGIALNPLTGEAASLVEREQNGSLGERAPRQDGGLKVRGEARYAIEHAIDGMLYGVAVQSTIPAGQIASIDVSSAEKAPGVVAVYTHQKPLDIKPATPFIKGGAATENFTPLQDDQVRWNGQHIALVVAQSFEQATEAANLLRVSYKQTSAIINPDDARAKPQRIDDLQAKWGDAEAALASAAVRIEGVYTTPREYNVPMEPHACIAHWEADRLTVYESSQWVGGARNVIAQWMGVDMGKVRVVSPFIGGGFGCKVAPHPHVAMACAAARALGKPLKVSLTRPQTFTSYGGRPRTSQRLALGATKEGMLVSVVHEGWNETAIDDIHLEPTTGVTALMYATPNMLARHSIIPVNTVNPGWMRAPGENISTYALETAMDELAVALGLDPIELRLRNWASRDQKANIPWTTRRLREGYIAGANAFGWANRNPKPRSMREGRELIGWGMAAGTYPVWRTPGEAKIVIHQDGRIDVLSAGTDLGTGTYTILAQTAAEVLDVPTRSVKVSLGDTDLPRAPIAGGSQLANNLTGAVYKAAKLARSELLRVATTHPKSPLHGMDIGNLVFRNGRIKPSHRPGDGVTLADLLRAIGKERFEVSTDTFTAGATEADRSAAAHGFSQMLPATHGGVSAHSWGVHFVEVRVDEDFGTVKVKRMVGAFDSGRVYNPKLAESQWMGGMIMGIGQALFEEGHIDRRDGRIVNASLADYVVPVNADVPEIITIDVGIPDLQASALGGKAVGELGIVGVAAAINNAVYHATGKRIRDLPITMDKLLA